MTLFSWKPPPNEFISSPVAIDNLPHDLLLIHLRMSPKHRADHADFQ